MKILQVVSTPPYARATGGCARVVFELSKQLAAMKHDVTLCTTNLNELKNSAYRTTRVYKVENVNIVEFPNISRNLALKHKLYLAPGLVRYLREHVQEYDIVHLQDLLSIHAMAASRFSFRKGVPYVLSTHGSMAWLLKDRPLNRLVLSTATANVIRKARKVIALTAAEELQLQQAGVPTEKITRIPNGIDVTRFQNLPAPGGFRHKYALESKKVILYLGRIHQRKGIDFLIRAFSSLATMREDVALVISGQDDGYSREVRMLVKELGIEDRVVLTGFVKDEREAYQDADVLVYPSVDEIFGLVPFEAIMCGTPVIVADDCGCGEIVRDADCGFLVQYGNTEMLCNLIDKAIGTSNEKMIERGETYVTDKLSWESVASQVEILYEQITHQPTKTHLDSRFQQL